MDEILKDERFAHIATDPRYKKLPKALRKVKIDKRFQSIFNGKQFNIEYTIDKRGRPVNHSSSDNFRKYYELSSEDGTTDDNDSDDDVESNKKISDSKKSVEKVEGTGDVDPEDDDSDSGKSHLKIKERVLTSEKSDSDGDNASGNEVDEIKCKSSKLDDIKIRRKLPDEIREKLHNLNVDYARGMGTLMSDSSSDEETDVDYDEASEEELEHNWGELDKDAGTTDTATHRLAICNMDWDRIRAVDLMVLCSSFVPTSGHIKSITIYPSEFGLKRMKEEELKGPIELVKDRIEIGADEVDENDDDDGDEESKEGSKYHMERLRQYQLNRLKYYYAVVVCDSAETASKIYSECDGMEYESSATKLDLRFIPDDVTFDEEPREVCTEIQDVNKYEPRFFVNTALQQGKVTCTWDETDPARTQLAQKIHQMKGGADNLNDEDLQMFLASSSGDDSDSSDDNDEDSKNKNTIKDNDSSMDSTDDSSEEDDHNSSSGKKLKSADKCIEKYRSLLNKIQEAEEKKRNRDVEMEITWGVGLKEKAQALVDKKMKENSEQTPFEKMIEKKKEKRKQKREEKIKKKKEEESTKNNDESVGNDALFSDDDLPDDINLNDDYFKDELGDKIAKKSKKNKNKKKGYDELNDEEKQKRDELELLLIDDEDKDGGIQKNHFSLKKIQDSEQNPTKKKRKGRKQIIKNRKHEKDLNTVEDDFQVDVADKRFEAVFTSHHFNIDPADSHFRKTKGMDAFIKEKINRKYKAEDSSEEYSKSSKIQRLSSDLSSVVSSIKKKTKGLK